MRIEKTKYILEYTNGFLSLFNLLGERLQHFPFSTQLTLSDGTVYDIAGEPLWENNRLSLQYQNLSSPLGSASLILTLNEDCILTEFSTTAAQPTAIHTLEYFRKGNKALSVNDNNFYFSPAPYNTFGHGSSLYKRPCNCSTDSYFAPPPFLMLSGNRFGKIAYSLLDLPNSYQYRMSEKFGILADMPGGNLHLSAGDTYIAPRLMLTFPTDEWCALAEYYSKLREYGLIDPCPIEQKNWPAWWKRFAVDCYGDQCTQLQYNAYTADDWASPEYNINWLYCWLNHAEKRLAQTDFTIVVDAFWQYEWSIDPYPDQNRFHGLRGFIDECHRRGHKVLLWIIPFSADRRTHLSPETQTLAERFRVLSSEQNRIPHVDWSSEHAEAYIKELCRVLFGNAPDCLDADGVKIDGPFQIPDPMKVSYAHPEKGIGVRELRRFYRMFTSAAQQIKSDVLVNTSTVNPFFENDIHINRLGDQSVRDEREIRARIASLVSPNILLDSDSVMNSEHIKEDYLTATVYSVPYLYNTEDFLLGERPDDATMQALGRLLSLSEKRPMGRPVYESNGNWRWETNGRTTAACFDSHTIIVFSEDGIGYIFSWHSGIQTLPLFGWHLPDSPSSNEITLHLHAGEIHTFTFTL